MLHKKTKASQNEQQKKIRRKLDGIQSSVSKVYELHKNKTENPCIEPFYEKMCSALSIFADVTGWLAEDLSLDRTEDEGGRVELTKKWISTAKSIMKMLEDTEAAYTTYEESPGMESDQSVSSLFLNIKRARRALNSPLVTHNRWENC